MPGLIKDLTETTEGQLGRVVDKMEGKMRVFGEDLVGNGIEIDRL